jgi:hypothetical protein
MSKLTDKEKPTLDDEGTPDREVEDDGYVTLHPPFVEQLDTGRKT